MTELRMRELRMTDLILAGQEVVTVDGGEATKPGPST